MGRYGGAELSLVMNRVEKDLPEDSPMSSHALACRLLAAARLLAACITHSIQTIVQRR
jgi:hypothetical protein